MGFKHLASSANLAQFKAPGLTDGGGDRQTASLKTPEWSINGAAFHLAFTFSYGEPVMLYQTQQTSNTITIAIIPVKTLLQKFVDAVCQGGSELSWQGMLRQGKNGREEGTTYQRY